MKRELELKFYISNKTNFINILNKKNIILSDPFIQNDIIFFRKGKRFSDLENGEPVIRIRQSNSQITTTLKKYKNGILDRTEIECKIEDSVNFQKFLELLEIFPVVTVNKTRQTGSYKGATIVLDNVSELGVFAEIEIISRDNCIEEDKKRLNKIAEELEFNLNSIVEVAYDEMLFNNAEKKGGV